MALKYIAFATLVAAASAEIFQSAPTGYQAHVAPFSYSHSAPVAYAAPAPKKEVVADPYEYAYDHHPHYTYSYEVHDPHTGDAKSHQESRNDDAVEGSYSLIEADGSRRVVHYTADDHHGFNAVVEKQPAPVGYKAPVPVKTVAPVKQAPVVYQHAAPSYAHQEPKAAHSYYH